MEPVHFIGGKVHGMKSGCKQSCLTILLSKFARFQLEADVMIGIGANKQLTGGSRSRSCGNKFGKVLYSAFDDRHLVSCIDPYDVNFRVAVAI